MATRIKQWAPVLGALVSACSPQTRETTGNQESFSPLTFLDGASLATCRGNTGKSLQMRYFGGQGRIRIKGQTYGIAFDSTGAIDGEESSRYIHSWFEGPLRSITRSEEDQSFVLRFAAGSKMETDSEVPGHSGSILSSPFFLQEIRIHPTARAMTFLDQNSKAVKVQGCEFRNLSNLLHAMNEN